jgi:hypothetical protein
MFTFPHQTLSSVMLSLTIKRSCGERPVNSPVLIASAPVEFSIRLQIIDSESWHFQFLVQKAKSIA